jgi:sulfur-oxidizing protein SoxA
MEQCVTRKILLLSIFLGLTFAASAQADPEEDRLALVKYYTERFPDVPLQEFGNGLYAFDENAREQWLEMEDFPPYEIAIEDGQALFETPFANGKSYADCFDNGGIGVRQDYPRFDASSGEVLTLELAINHCREANGEDALPYQVGDLAAISAYMAYTSRGNPINVIVADDDPAAIAAYEAGKQYYYTRRGQLNFSCISCHLQSAGLQLRADRLSTSLGHATHWPVYRSKWGEIGTLQKRFAECNTQVFAKPLEAQSIEYRNLEYFLTYMSNGLELNGPATRR